MYWRLRPILVIAVVVLMSSFGRVVSAGQITTRPIVGEVRLMAVPFPRSDTIDRLHSEGWIEAHGELLPVSTYPELYKTIGRAWTANGVEEARFAVPALSDLGQRYFTADVYGVMGPGDLVTGGRQIKPWFRDSPLSYWIFVGRAVSATDLHAAR